MACRCGGDLGFLTFNDPDDELAGLIPYEDDDVAGLVPYGGDLAGLVPVEDDDLAGLVPVEEDDLAGCVPFKRAGLGGLVPVEDDDLGDLASSAGAGLAAGAATGNPYVGVAVGLADALGLDVAELYNDFVSWLGFDDCSSDNKKKYQRMIANATPQQRLDWAKKRRVGGSKGNCAKYALRLLAQAITKDEANYGKTKDLAEVERRRQALELQRQQRAEAARAEQLAAEMARMQAQQAAIQAEKERRRRRNMYLAGGVAAVGTGIAAAIHFRRKARPARGRAA